MIPCLEKDQFSLLKLPSIIKLIYCHLRKGILLQHYTMMKIYTAQIIYRNGTKLRIYFIYSRRGQSHGT